MATPTSMTDISGCQLDNFLQQIATPPRSSSSSKKFTCDGSNQQLIDQAESAIDVLLKVGGHRLRQGLVGCNSVCLSGGPNP